MVSGKVDAIKQVRQLSISPPIAIERDANGRRYLSIGVGLKDVKDLVEAIIEWADKTHSERVVDTYKPLEKTLGDWTMADLIREINMRYNG